MYDEEKSKLRSEQLKKEYENALYAKERESKKAMDLATELTDNLNKKRFESNIIFCIFWSIWGFLIDTYLKHNVLWHAMYVCN